MPDNKEIQVDNHTYDVNSLSKIHPGGELFVKLFAGRDATHAFLSYHRRVFPHEKMREHRKSSLPERQNQETNYLELCSLIEQVVPVHKSYATTGYYVKATVLLTSAMSLEAYMHYHNHYVWYLTGTLGLIMALIGLNVQHDANHGAISRRPWVNRMFGMSQNWIGGSALDWMHQHVVQHHLYTNDVVHDPDIQGSALLRFNPIKSVAPHHTLQHIYFFFLIGLMGMDIIVESFYNNMVGFHHTAMSPWLHRPKRKMGQDSYKKIRKYLCILFNDVKAPRRALGYFTITTYYSRNGYPILLEFVFSSVSQRSFTRC